jgi:hypothetical protein
MFKKLNLIFFLCFLNFIIYAQNITQIIKPKINGHTSFAIFVDDKTYSKISETILEYQRSVEEKKLPCYIIVGKWNYPDEIRSEIIKLYNNKPKLEGVVFIGDIPIAMIRDAQHYTSAFKMDQKKFPFIKSSVPSDRFYDDFDLHFKFLNKDTTDELLYYYSLLPTSSPIIEKEIYSARIKPTLKGEEKYQQIDKFLKKVIRIKKEKNPLNKFLYGCAEGYVSNSHDAFISEVLSYSESFPKTKEQDGLFYKFFHVTSKDMKFSYLRQLNNIKDLDLSLLTAHGEPDYQIIKYVSPKDSTNEAKEESFKLSNLLVEDLRKQEVSSRVNICNSCFNGAFIHYPYLAGEYIFSDGNCVVTRANSVNELQDIWTLEDAALLAEGINVGKWHQVSNNYLESHLFGDPTFSFDSQVNKDLIYVMNSHTKNELSKLKTLAKKSQLPIVRALSLNEIFKIEGNKCSSFLKDVFLNDKSSDVRTKALKLISRIKDENFETVIKSGINDPNEFIRRISVKLLGEVGKEEYIPILMKKMLLDPSERVTSSAEGSLIKINPKKSYEYGRMLIDTENDFKKDSLFIKRVDLSIKSKTKWIDETIEKLENKNAKGRITEIRSLRGNRYNIAPQYLIKIIENDSETDEIRCLSAEAIGWYYYNYDINNYIQRLEKVSNDKNISEDLKNTLSITIKRLKYGPNYTLTP